MEGHEIYKLYPRSSLLHRSVYTTLLYCLFYHPKAPPGKITCPSELKADFHVRLCSGPRCMWLLFSDENGASTGVGQEIYVGLSQVASADRRLDGSEGSGGGQCTAGLDSAAHLLSHFCFCRGRGCLALASSRALAFTRSSRQCMKTTAR